MTAVTDMTSMPAARPAARKTPKATFDIVFRNASFLAALLVLVLPAGIMVSMVIGGWPAFREFGLGFITSSVWDTQNEQYGGWPAIVGTLSTALIAVVIGVPLGFLAALRPGSWIDMLSMVFAVSGLSLPLFWLGLLLMYAFALTLGWFPSFGYGDGNPRYIVLPAFALGVAPLALLARTARAAVLEVMHADFIRTARAKGAGSYRVMRRHVLRNALVIVLTTLGLQFGSVLGQAVVVEKLFAWPGLGSLLVDSVTWRDIPVVQGCILTIVLFFLVVNIAVDVLCAVVDPRIKYS